MLDVETQQCCVSGIAEKRIGGSNAAAKGDFWGREGARVDIQ
jgi:hypothetical protein